MSKSRRFLKRRREIDKCRSKIKYLDYSEAARAAKRTGIGAYVYRCPGERGETRHFHVSGGRR